MSPQLEWNRELNVRNPSRIGIEIKAQNPLSVTLVRDSSFKAMKQGRKDLFHKEDVIFTEDALDGNFEKIVSVDIGKYWFIIMNSGESICDIQMKWYEVE